jgi:hypothetical protein
VTIFFSFYPVPRPFRELNWEIGHEAAILPSWMWEYLNPDPDLIKLPQKILSDIRTDSCLFSVGPSYKRTDRTAGPPVFDTSATIDYLFLSDKILLKIHNAIAHTILSTFTVCYETKNNRNINNSNVGCYSCFDWTKTKFRENLYINKSEYAL